MGTPLFLLLTISASLFIFTDVGHTGMGEIRFIRNDDFVDGGLGDLNPLPPPPLAVLMKVIFVPELDTRILGYKVFMAGHRGGSLRQSPRPPILSTARAGERPSGPTPLTDTRDWHSRIDNPHPIPIFDSRGRESLLCL